MELRHVRVALALGEELHFGRTASRLRVAQSAVSQTLRSLEDEIGTTLFNRSRRAVTVTPAGERFLAQARLGLAAIEQGAVEARRVASGASGTLCVHMSFMSALTLAPRAIARFQSECPGVTVRVEPGGSAAQLEALRAGRCDVGLMSLKRDVAPLETEVLETAALVAVVGSNHRLARRESVRLEDLARDRMVFLKQTSEPETYAKFRKRCGEAGFDLQVSVEVEQLEVLLGLVAAGIGVSCVPGLVGRMPFPGAVCVPITPAIRTGISVVWDPKTLSNAGARFLDVLRDERATSAGAL